MASLQELQEISIRDVLELTGTRFETRGKRINFLCPSHDDHRLGSCMTCGENNRRWKCYACGAGGDVIHLVQAIEKTNFQGACAWLAANCLGDEFESSPVANRKLLSRDKLRLIGLSEDDGPVCGATAHYPDMFMSRSNELLEEEPGGRISWHCSDADDDDYITVDRVLCKRPLAALCEENEAAYRELIFRKATEAKARYMAMITAAETQRGNSEMERCSIQAASIVGVSAWTQSVQEIVRKIDDIIIEYGDVKKEKEEISKPQKLGGLFGGLV